jgi:hypothetical protein
MHVVEHAPVGHHLVVGTGVDDRVDGGIVFCPHATGCCESAPCGCNKVGARRRVREDLPARPMPADQMPGTPADGGELRCGSVPGACRALK